MSRGRDKGRFCYRSLPVGRWRQIAASPGESVRRSGARRPIGLGCFSFNNQGS